MMYENLLLISIIYIIVVYLMKFLKQVTSMVRKCK